MNVTMRLKEETDRNGFSIGHLKWIFNCTLEEQVS